MWNPLLWEKPQEAQYYNLCSCSDLLELNSDLLHNKDEYFLAMQI